MSQVIYQCLSFNIFVSPCISIVRPPLITAAYVNQSLHYVGDRTVFICRGEGYGRLYFSWERQSGNISTSALVDVNDGTLIIPELLLSNKGHYRCIVRDEWNGTVYSEFLQLNVSESKSTTA